MSSFDSLTASSQTSLNGDAWNADAYNAVASFVYSKEFTTPVLGLLNAQPGERILDLGCGSGDLTLVLKQLVGENGVVLGVDASENMVKKARQNGVSASLVADAQDLHLPPTSPVDKEVTAALPDGFDYEFDAVFTNAVLHWCKRDPNTVVRGVAKILRKGGRFVGEMGGYLNIVGLRSAMHVVLRRRGLDVESLDPWYFPSTDEYRKVLESAGFRVIHISLNPRITPLSSDIVDWQRTFCRKTIYSGLSDADAEEVMREVQDMCAIDSRDANGRWTVMYCRLRFVAILD